MPLQPERVFDPAQPVYVRRFLVAGGRHLDPGTAFEWRRWAISERRVRQLFDAGKLMHQAARGDAAVQPVAPQVSTKPEATDEPRVNVPAPATEQQPPAPVENDGLDDLNMKELRAIAEAEGAPTRLRRDDQRAAIREHRRERAGG